MCGLKTSAILSHQVSLTVVLKVGRFPLQSWTHLDGPTASPVPPTNTSCLVSASVSGVTPGSSCKHQQRCRSSSQKPPNQEQREKGKTSGWPPAGWLQGRSQAPPPFCSDQRNTGAASDVQGNVCVDFP